MFSYPEKVKYPSDKQVEIWNLRLKRLTGREIAKQKKVTPGFVSKTLKEANTRIKALLENAARMNKITLSHISAKLGFAQGYSHTFKIRVHITYSQANGVQVWYDHKGECASCDELGTCREMLIQEFKARDLKLPHEAVRPTDLCDTLFNEIRKMLK